MEMAGQGSKTFAKRKALFEKRRSVLEEKIAELQQEMNMIQFKCWYYEMAQELGSEEAVKARIPISCPKKSVRIMKTVMDRNS